MDEKKPIPLWRVEWYGGSRHHTVYVAADSFAAAAQLAHPLVEKTLADGEQAPAVNTVRHGDVHVA